MKKKGFPASAAIAIVLALGLMICSCDNGKKVEGSTGPALNEQQINDEIGKRKPVVADWFAAADEIVKRAKNKNADIIWALISNSYGLLAPGSIEDKPTAVLLDKIGCENPHYGIIPLMKGDAEKYPPWARMCHSNQAAFVMTEGKTLLVIKDHVPFSKFWKGILILHEGSHVYTRIKGTLDHIDDLSARRAVDDYYAYSLECELLLAIGGEKYKKFLKREVGRLKRQYKKDEGILPPDYEASTPKLTEIFGPYESDTERGSRGSVFWIHAVFSLFEEIYGRHNKEAENKKIDFLLTMYERELMG